MGWLLRCLLPLFVVVASGLVTNKIDEGSFANTLDDAAYASGDTGGSTWQAVAEQKIQHKRDEMAKVQAERVKREKAKRDAHVRELAEKERMAKLVALKARSKLEELTGETEKDLGEFKSRPELVQRPRVDYRPRSLMRREVEPLSQSEEEKYVTMAHSMGFSDEAIQEAEAKYNQRAYEDQQQVVDPDVDSSDSSDLSESSDSNGAPRSSVDTGLSDAGSDVDNGVYGTSGGPMMAAPAEVDDPNQDDGSGVYAGGSDAAASSRSPAAGNSDDAFGGGVFGADPNTDDPSPQNVQSLMSLSRRNARQDRRADLGHGHRGPFGFANAPADDNKHWWEEPSIDASGGGPFGGSDANTDNSNDNSNGAGGDENPQSVDTSPGSDNPQSTDTSNPPNYGRSNDEETFHDDNSASADSSSGDAGQSADAGQDSSAAPADDAPQPTDDFLAGLGRRDTDFPVPDGSLLEILGNSKAKARAGPMKRAPKRKTAKTKPVSKSAKTKPVSKSKSKAASRKSKAKVKAVLSLLIKSKETKPKRAATKPKAKSASLKAKLELHAKAEKKVMVKTAVAAAKAKGKAAAKKLKAKAKTKVASKKKQRKVTARRR